MNDNSMTDFPEMDDPVLDRELLSLGYFEPASDFADRVMSRVRRPAPGWYRVGERAARSLVKTRRRVWTLAGGLGASWAVATAAAAVLIFKNVAVLQGAWAGLSRGALDSLWETAMTGVTAWIVQSSATSQFYTAINFITEHPGIAIASATLMGVISLISMWGLLKILAQHSGGRIPVHAIR